MLRNCHTNAVLVSNPHEKMVSSDAFAVTATQSNNGPNTRSVFVVKHANDSSDEKIRYGQEVRLSTLPELSDRELYLNSLPLTPMTFARFSRNQEVSVYYRKAYNTVWKIQPSSGIREDRQGEPVRADESIILEHAATANYLTNDHIKYQNTFGSELEVSCMAQSKKNKT